jgi:hypothetical protein
MPALAKRRFRRSMTFAAAARRRIQQLGPYKSLAVLLIPLLIVEPLKMTGVAFVGLGHWVAGACMIVGGYAAGLLVIERLFRVVKSKLYTIKWCAALASQLQVTRARWRSRRVFEPSPSDVTIVRQVEAVASKLLPWRKLCLRREASRLGARNCASTNEQSSPSQLPTR